MNSNPNIYAIDPCLPSVNWLNKEIHFRKGYFPEAIKNEKFQYAYAVIIDYTMTDTQYLEFLEDLIKFGIKRIHVSRFTYR